MSANPASGSTSTGGMDPRRAKALTDYRKKLLEHRELDARLKDRKFLSFLFILSTPRQKIEVDFFWIVRLGLRDLVKEHDKTDADIKALQSVGQIIGEVLKQLDEERCK